MSYVDEIYAKVVEDVYKRQLMNMLGLVCDPVGGLVEYPCQNRNAAGVANALIAAEMALAGIPQLIPFDEMMNTMYSVCLLYTSRCV